METNIEANSMEDVVKIINDMSNDQEFIIHVDCFNRSSEDECDGR